MSHHIFFSWQSDTPPVVGRNLIEGCLKAAIKHLNADAELDLADRDLAFDKDTLNVAGSPAIADTIFRKIDRALLFVCDLTYVSRRENGDGIPNPNALIEYGWALRSLGLNRIIFVMNTAFGDPNEVRLPFDLRHLRHPIIFNCPPDADRGTLSAVKDLLTRQITTGLKAAFAAGEVKALIRDASPQDDRAELAVGALHDLATHAFNGMLPELVSKPFLTLRLAPFAATEAPRLDPTKVNAVIARFPPSVSDKVKTGANGAQWWSCAMPRRIEGLPNPETLWQMRLVRPGNLEFQMTIGRRINDDPTMLVDGRWLEAQVVRNLERMTAIANELGLAGPAAISVSLKGMEDVELTRSRPGGNMIGHHDVFLPTPILEDMRAPIADQLRDSFDRLWLWSGWPDGSPSFSSGEWAGYNDSPGYEIG